MAHVTLPRTNQTGVNDWEDVEANDRELRDEINGGLDNSNLSASAAIAHSKLASGTAGQLLIANASGVITSTTVSGDVTISNTGVTTIGNDKVTADQLKDSVSTDGDRAVTSNHIRDGAVTNAKITWPAWAAYASTPTWTSTTNPAIGNGTIAGHYVQLGKTVHFRVKITMGSTTTYGSGGYSVGLPVAHNHGAESAIGRVHMLDTSASTRYGGQAYTVSSNSDTVFLSYTQASLSLNSSGGITATGPFTWASGDILTVTGTYEAA